MIISVPAHLIACDGCQRVLYEDRGGWQTTVLAETTETARHAARLAG